MKVATVVHHSVNGIIVICGLYSWYKEKQNKKNIYTFSTTKKNFINSMNLYD